MVLVDFRKFISKEYLAIFLMGQDPFIKIIKNGSDFKILFVETDINNLSNISILPSDLCI